MRLLKMADENDCGSAIRAAGGLVWRDSTRGREVAVIHRARYGDWTLPKGKLNPGEDWRDAAVREVKEETGCTVRLIDFAGTVSYETGGRQKVVQYWNMESVGQSEFEPSEEVEEIRWLSVKKALEVLDYDGERELLRKSVNEAKGRSCVRRLFHWIHNGICGKSADDSRLAGDLDYYLKRLEYLKQENNSDDDNWSEKAEKLLDSASKALDEDDRDRSFICLNSARSFMFLGMKEDDLRAEAQAIINEAEAPNKVNAWRKKTIQDYLCQECKPKPNPKTSDLFYASRILFESYHNTYNKIWRIKKQLGLLSIVTLLTIGLLMFIIPPLDHKIFAVDNQFILSVILFGVLGACISGILTVERSGAASRITDQLIDFRILFSRLFVGAASALVVFAFILSGILSYNAETAQIMAISFAAGFSERLLTSAIESVTKK
jgi:8-oxo-dGTP pyrophosphatase MutT (NUDIX family)